MNSEITLTNYSTSATTKSHVRLLFKRNDLHHAVLLEDNVPRYFLTTSDDLNKVKICDATQRFVAYVNRRIMLEDVFTFGDRSAGKAMKVTDVLAPTTRDGKVTVAMRTEEGAYYWCKMNVHHWTLCEGSSYTPVAWTETVAGSAPTWALIIESRALNVLDYALASLFYLKASTDHDITEAGMEWASVDHRAAYFSTK